MRYVLLFLVVITQSYYSSAQDLGLSESAERISAKDQIGFKKVVSRADSLFRVETYYPSGKLYSDLKYKDEALTVLEGSAKYYYENGNLDAEGNYRANKRQGDWKFYFPTGLPSGNIFFKEGRVGTSDHMVAQRKVLKKAPSYTTEDRFPTFRGGKTALAMYIRENFKPLQKSLGKEKISGVMKIGFVVSEKGKVTNVHVVSGINDRIDKKAIKRISAMPNWHPGMQLNTPVRVPLILPIVF